MNLTNRTAALINGKDISPDFEIYFDDENIVRGDHKFLGYIAGIPVECSWVDNNNQVIFSPLKDNSIECIQNRISSVIKEIINNDSELEELCDIWNENIVISFWWK